MRLAAIVLTLVAVGCAHEPLPAGKPLPGEPLPAALDKRQIVNGMSAVKIDVANCYDRYRQQGQFDVHVRIEPDGKVSDVSWPKNAPSATTECIAAAARKARFPPFAGPPRTIDYPFILR